jgi:hypothetical protein
VELDEVEILFRRELHVFAFVVVVVVVDWS